MKPFRTLFFIASIVFIGTSCQTFDHPISPEPLIITKDLTGVYEAIDTDEGPFEPSDTLRVYMPYPGIYTLELETITKTDSTESSETNNIGIGHFSKFENELYFNQTIEGEWIYHQMDFKQKPFKAYTVRLNNFEKHMTHDQILNELKSKNFVLSDEMILNRKRDLE